MEIKPRTAQSFGIILEMKENVRDARSERFEIFGKYLGFF